jgi:hypothetical protein
MYNGEVIDEYELGQLPPAKPLGVGKIPGLNIGATSISKMSVSVLFPSQMNDEQFKVYLSMIQHNIDKFGDPSTEKVDYYPNNINPQNGDLFSTNTMTTPLSYDDYGIQNEIQDEEKHRVTDSTQKITCVYYNITDNGKVVEGFEDLYDNMLERNKLLNKVNNRNMQAVIDELGMEYDDARDMYHLPDSKVKQFRELLLDMFVNRLMPENVMEGLDYVLDSQQKVFDLFTDRDRVEQVLTAFVKNNVIKRKVHGEMLVQTPAYMYDPALKIYEKGKDGAKTSRAEVMIPIPEDWQPWVKKIGGIKALNIMLERGKLDKRLIDFVANRIPTAELNTIEAFTVKKFLPYHVGAIIVLPEAIVAKTSSDYDIDKLTSYLPNYRLIDDVPQYIEYKEGEEESDSAIENRLNELHAEAILHPKRYDLLMTPHSSRRIKEMAKEMYKPSTPLEKLMEEEQGSYSALNQWWYNNIKGKSFWGGIQGLSIAAASNTINAQYQLFPIRIEDRSVKLFFEGQKLGKDEQYSNGFIKDHDGNFTSDNYGQTVVGTVDVAKDDSASKIGMSYDTLGVWSFLTNTGIKNGVGYRQIAAMMSHPIVKEYLARLDASRSMILHSNKYATESWGYEKNKWFENNVGYSSDIVDDLIVKYSEKNKDGKPVIKYGYPRKYEDTLAAAWEASEKDKKKFKGEFIKKSNDSKYEYMSADQMKNATGNRAIQILDNFLMYKSMSWKSGALGSALRSYASNSFGKTLNELQLQEAKIFNLIDDQNQDPFFNTTDILNHIESSFIKSTTNAVVATGMLYRWTSFIRKYPELKSFFDVEISKHDKMSKKDANKSLKLLRNEFLSFVYSFYNDRFGEDGDTRSKMVERAQDRYRQLFLGDNSIPKRLNKIKDKISNGALNALRPVINEYSNELGRNRENGYITSFTKKYGIVEQNMLSASFQELMNSSDPEVRSFAEDLFEFSVFQNGMGNSSISYMYMVPNSEFIPSMDQIMNWFIGLYQESTNKEAMIRSFKDQMARNNYKNKAIVYRHNKTLSEDSIPEGETVASKYKNYAVNPKATSSRYDYITVRYYKSKRQERYENKKSKTRNPVEYLLYKKTGNVLRNGDLEYTLVNKLGDGERFKEYYATVDGVAVKSILKTNAYEGIINNNKDTLEKKKKSVNDKKETNKPSIDDLRSRMAQLDTYDTSKPNEEIDNSMLDFLSAIKVTTKSVDVIKNKFGTAIPAVAMSDLINMTLEIVQNKRNFTSLPEEAAHFYVALLDENSNLYKVMYDNIVNYPIYNKVKEQYGELYNNDEKLIRDEAIGKLIADKIVNDKSWTTTDRQKQQVNTWWSKIWNYIKELFNKTKSDPYVKAAYDIMNKNISELNIRDKNNKNQETLYNRQQVINFMLSGLDEESFAISKESFDKMDKHEFNELAKITGFNSLGNYWTLSSVSNLYQLDHSIIDEWNKISATSKGLYKVEYFKNRSQASEAYDKYVNIFGPDNVSLANMEDSQYTNKVSIKKPLAINSVENKIMAKDDVTIHNMKEVSKAPIRDFDTYFPDMDYLEDEEKEGMMKAVENGEIIISCEF